MAWLKKKSWQRSVNTYHLDSTTNILLYVVTHIVLDPFFSVSIIPYFWMHFKISRRYQYTSGEGNGTPSRTLAGKIPWTEEPGGLQSMGLLRVGHDLVTSLSLFTFMHWRRKWHPTPVFLPGESQGWRSLVGCHLMRFHRVGHDWRDLAAASVHFNSKCFSMCIID